MAQTARSLLVPTLVYLGAVILIGLPSTYATYAMYGFLLESAGLSSLLASDLALVAVFGVSLVIGLQLAVEAAALQLGGIDALDRGSPTSSLLRHLVLVAVVALVATTLVTSGLSMALDLPEPAGLVIGSLVALVSLFVLYRSTAAFVEGLDATEA